MKIMIIENLPYSFLALTVLVIFYGIYFIKKLSQRQKGIQTMQIGKRKEADIHKVEVLMGIATTLTPFVQLFSIILGLNHFPSLIRYIGFGIGLLGDLIFLLSVLCMKDSWRAGIPLVDKTKLITSGIYKYSRNPAFLGFDLMYVGVFLIYGNLLTFCFSVFAMVMLHLQILQEEKYLSSTFKDEYIAYKGQVFRYFGKK